MTPPDSFARAETAYAAGQLDQARAAYTEVLQGDPAHPVALRKLAWIYDHLGSTLEAAALFERLIAASPADARAYQDLGLCLIKLKRVDEAIASLRRATEVDPGYAPALCNLGLALEEHGDFAGATVALERALGLGHHREFVAYHLAAIQYQAGMAQHAPATCPPGYLVQLFDGYADRFDQHLFNTLGYCGPALLAKIIAGYLGAIPVGPWDVMDLGCGTGMSAVPFRASAKHVIGVDLSPRMLRQATHRKMPSGQRVYDLLIRADLNDVLVAYPDSFDLILAADVFIYIGDLSSTFAAVQRSLRAGGLFAFTIETHNGAEDFALRATRRYAQSQQYITRLFAKTGLEILGEQAVFLRNGDDGCPVAGRVYLARRV